MVKIDLGAHVDGYIVVAAHTVIVKEIAVAGKINYNSEMAIYFYSLLFL